MWLLKSSHKHINQETLSEYLDGRLQGRDLERVDLRLGECGPCRQALDELRATVAMAQQLPMETPRRSFVMSAPPLEIRSTRPGLALRVPNWVYAGAASVAALALVVTVSMDASGGLSSDPLRQDDMATTTLAAAPVSEQLSVAAPADARESGGIASVEDEPTGGTGGGLPTQEFSAPPGSSPIPLVAPAQGNGGSDSTTEPAGGEPPPTAFMFDEHLTGEGGIPGPRSEPAPTATINESAKTLAVEESASPENAESAFDDPDGKTSIWWRVLEVAAGMLAVVFLAGLTLRWRNNRRDLA